MMLSDAVNVSIDSCAFSWVANGCCPYNSGSYIDITFDGTLRTCPFNVHGVPIKDVYDGTYESLFKLRCKPEKCKYKDIFGEINGPN